MRSYVGITVGPIFDTISDATSPAALWFASSMFSDITRRICQSLQAEESFQNVVIYSPYYASDINITDGVGKFHDRIIFSAEGFSHEVMKEILKKVKRETALCFPDDVKNDKTEAFFESYLQLHYVVKSEEQIGDKNCVLVLSSYLDAMELMKTFPQNNEGNLLHKLFSGKENNKNKFVKESPLFKRVQEDANQLKAPDNSIWTIEEIANCHNKAVGNWKRKHYYALVSADGDNMGRFLKQITSNQVTEFSKTCLYYDEAAAKLIGEYGGMTIYAGGDDLLFLAPVMTETDDIFHLCNEIQNLFIMKIKECEAFREIEAIPTISFGIAIRHTKYPLHEAIDASRTLLFQAKQDGMMGKVDCRKNNMMIGLQKHSGQSLSVLVPNEKYKVLDAFIKAGSTLSSEAESIHSALYTLDNLRSLIFVLNNQAKEGHINYARYQMAWMNLFDNEGQKQAEEYLTELCKLYYDELVMKNADEIIFPKENLSKDRETVESDTSLQTLLYLLKIKYFLAEKEGTDKE